MIRSHQNVSLRSLRVRQLAITITLSVLTFGVHAQMPLQVDGSVPTLTAKLPAFEAVSVKENKGDSRMMRVRYLDDGFDATNLPLRDLIVQAYGVRQDLVSGLPEWASSLHFDVNAKVDDGDVQLLKKLSREQRRAMLVAVLAERFHLLLHKEMRTVPTYDLLVDKGGSKLRVSQALPPDPTRDKNAPPDLTRAGMFTIGPDSISAVGVAVSMLTNQLAYATHRPVIDKTGLTGKYDIEIKWTPEEGELSRAESNGAEERGSLFTVLRERLGLKLVASKGPVESLVVDHVDKPSSN